MDARGMMQEPIDHMVGMMKTDALTPFDYPRLLMAHYRLQRNGNQALKDVRSMMRLCNELCESGACMAKLYEQVAQIRDGYLLILERVNNVPLLRFLKRTIKDSVAEWDDLAEDCLIASDSEFRLLVHRIAEAV